MKTYYLWTHLDGFIPNTEPKLKDWDSRQAYSPEQAVEDYVYDYGIEMIKFNLGAEVEVDGHGIFTFHPLVSAEKVAKKRSE